MIGIAYAMNHLHCDNIIHRNLKCENVFLDDNLYPKIGEFDHFKFAHSSKLEHAEMDGPVNMFDPEFIKGDSYSFPVDVFAYGMLFYYVISNEMPMIQHGNILELYMILIRGDLPKLDIIHPKYRTFLLRCWNKDQNLRPSFRNINNLWLDGVDENEITKYIYQYTK